MGSSFIYFPAVSIPSQYFVKRRGVATGIAVSGSGIGGLVISVATEKLLLSIGFSWAMRSTAFFSLLLLLAVNPLFGSRIVASRSQFENGLEYNERFTIYIIEHIRFL